MTYIEPTSLPTYLHPVTLRVYNGVRRLRTTLSYETQNEGWRLVEILNLCVCARGQATSCDSLWKITLPFSPSLGASSTVTREKLIMLKLLTAAKSRCSALLCPTPNLLLQLPASTVSGPSVMAPSPRWPVDRLSLVVCWQRNPGAWGRHASQDFPGDSYAPPSFVGGESHPLTLTR